MVAGEDGNVMKVDCDADDLCSFIRGGLSCEDSLGVAEDIQGVVPSMLCGARKPLDPRLIARRRCAGEVVADE
jgi:hypothetical protein